MKLPRHSQARNTVSELTSLRQAQITPGEAANVELAKWGAVTDGFNAASDVAKVISDTQGEMDKAHDKVQGAIEDAYFQDALEQNKKEHEERSINDPTWTRENYEENVRAILKTRGDAIKNVRNPQNRANAEKVHQANTLLTMSNAATDALDFEAKKIETNWTVAYNDALDNEQYERANMLLQTASDTETPIVGPLKAQELRIDLDKRLEKKQITDTATDLGDAVLDQYLNNGMQGGEKAYDALLRNENLEPEVKKQALLQAQVHRSNFMRSQQDDKDRENAEIIKTKTIYGANAERGQFTFAANDLALQQGDYGKDIEGSSAMAVWAEMYNKIDDYNKKQVGVLNVSNAVNTGEIIEPSKANRLALDGYMQQQVEATGIKVDSDEYFKLAANTAQSTGTLPQRELLKMNGGYVSSDQAEKYFPLWKYLNDNDQLKPDLGLTDDANTMYMAMDSLQGVPQETATELIWKARTLNKTDKDALVLDYEKEAPSKSFKTLINTDYFDAADPLFSLSFGPETQTAMEMEYAKVHKAVYMATNGNVSAATDAADKAIKAGWGPSNFGSADPDDYTIQRNPLGQDMSTFQSILVSQINNMKVEGYEKLKPSQAGVTFNAYTDEGYKQTKYLDKEAVSFYEIPQLDENRRDGVRRYQVWHNDRPVINMDTGMVLDFPISASDARNITRVSDMKKSRADEVDRITDRITELESSITKLKTAAKSGVVAMYGIGTIPEQEAELAGLKRALPNAKVRKDETMYSVYPMFANSQAPEVIN